MAKCFYQHFLVHMMVHNLQVTFSLADFWLMTISWNIPSSLAYFLICLKMVPSRFPPAMHIKWRSFYLPCIWMDSLKAPHDWYQACYPLHIHFLPPPMLFVMEVDTCWQQPTICISIKHVTFSHLMFQAGQFTAHQKTLFCQCTLVNNTSILQQIPCHLVIQQNFHSHPSYLICQVFFVCLHQSHHYSVPYVILKRAMQWN